MPSFEKIIADRVASIRSAADALPPPPPRHDSVCLVAAVWLEEDPRERANIPDGYTIRAEYLALPEPWLAAVRSLAAGAVDSTRCYRCGAYVGHCIESYRDGFDRELEREGWRVLALVRDGSPEAAGSITTVQCEACAPTVDMGPWPPGAPPARWAPVAPTAAAWDVADELAVALTAVTAYSLTGDDVRRILAATVPRG